MRKHTELQNRGQEREWIAGTVPTVRRSSSLAMVVGLGSVWFSKASGAQQGCFNPQMP